MFVELLCVVTFCYYNLLFSIVNYMLHVGLQTQCERIVYCAGCTLARELYWTCVVRETSGSDV